MLSVLKAVNNYVISIINKVFDWHHEDQVRVQKLYDFKHKLKIQKVVGKMDP